MADEIGSDVLLDEIKQTPDTQKLSRVGLFLAFIVGLSIDEKEIERAKKRFCLSKEKS